MSTIIVKSNPAVEAKFENYPARAKKKLLLLRKLIIETADHSDSINEIEETLKWGEPSYLVKKGSTIRIDWKAKAPNQYAIYFKCTSQLVPTFKEVFGDTFQYENNRAILFSLDEKLPKKELRECINMALHYHSLKTLPLLGFK